MTKRPPLTALMPTALGMMWLALFPLWQDGDFSRITASKHMGMIILTAVTVLATIRMLTNLRHEGTLRQSLRPGAVQILALSYFLLVAGSAVFGSMAASLNDAGQQTVLYGARRHEGLYTQLCYALIFFCMSLRPPQIRRVLEAAGDVLLLFCLVVALQYAGVNVLGLFPAGRSIRTNYEFQGTIGNIDMVSGYVSLIMPALLAAFVLMKRGGWLLFLSGAAGTLLMLCMEVQSGLIVLAVMLFCLILWALHDPNARARVLIILGACLLLVTVRSLIGLPWLDGTAEITFPHAFTGKKLLPAIGGAACLLLSLPVHRHPGKRLRGRWILLIAIAAIVLVLIGLYVLPLPAGSGLWEMQEVLHLRPQDAYGSERIGIWRLTLEMSRRNLLFGTGPDTFLYAMDAYMQETGQSLVQRFDNPHNMLLSVLGNNGLPAMVMFALLCLTALVGGLRKTAKEPPTLPLLMGCLCYLAQGMFTFSICLVTPMFYAMLGILTAQINNPDAE